MSFIKKISLLFFVSGTTSIGVVGSKGFNSSINEWDESKKEEEIEKTINIIKSFLEKSGKETKLSAFIEEYSSTVTGFKDLSEVLVNSFLLELIEGSSSDVSLLKTQIKNSLDSLKLRTSSFIDENEKKSKYELYGGEEKFKNYHAIKGIKGIFIEELIKQLPSLIEANVEGLNNDNSSDDLIKKIIGKFYDSALDDYIKHNKPLFVYRWTFEYSDENIKDKLKSIFTSIEESKIPSKAGYLFPYIKEKEKWEELTKDKDLNNPHSKIILPLSSFVDNDQYSSQFIIAALKLHKQKGTAEISSVKFLDENSNGSVTPEILETQNGVYFRDKNHIQFLKKEEVANIKKKIIESAKNGSEYLFDIQNELKTWLKQHFNRIFLAMWKDLETNYPKSKEFKDLANSLEKLLLSSILKDNLIKLRKNAIKDYVEIEKMYGPVKGNDGKYERNPLLKFSGKLPYNFYEPENSGTLKKWNEMDLTLDEIESIYLSEQGNSQDKLNESYVDSFKQNFDDFKKKLKATIEKLEVKPEENNLYSFKKENENDRFSTNEIFNNLWIDLVHSGKAKNYIIQSQMQKYLLDKEASPASGESTENNGKLLSEDFFKKISEEKDEKYKKIFRRYLVSKISKDLKDSPHPNILKKDLLKNIFDDSKTEDIKQLLNVLKTKYNDEGKDILSDYSKNMAFELVTIDFLSKNNLQNYRKLLKNKFSNNSLYFFLFSKKYDSNGICHPETKSNLKIDLNKVWKFKNDTFTKEEKNDGWTPLDCLAREDILDFAKIKNDGFIAGYKGLVSDNKFKDFFPEEITSKLKAFSPWHDANNLQKNIEELKTHESMDDLLESLKLTFPNTNWSFVEQKKWINPEWHLKSSDISLEDRKKILVGFLCSTDEPKIDKNFSLSYKLNRQVEFRDTSGRNIKDGFLKDLFKKQNGYFEDEGNKLLEDKNKNKYLIYMISLSQHDVLNDENWKQFLEKIDFDVVAHDLIQRSQDKNTQKNVIHYLLSKENSGLSKINIGDDRLQKQIGFEWLN